jgi:hypothetical protein
MRLAAMATLRMSAPEAPASVDVVDSDTEPPCPADNSINDPPCSADASTSYAVGTDPAATYP